MIVIEYREIAGYPGYRVGSDGSVWSRFLSGSAKGPIHPWHQLRPCPNSNGYLGVKLWANGRASTKAVHVLVATAFRGPCPPGHEVAHDNGNKSDNSLDNVLYKTHAENINDRVRHGTDVVGEKCHNASLTEQDVRAIIEEHKAIGNCAEIGRRRGMNRRRVYAIVTGKAWKHITASKRRAA